MNKKIGNLLICFSLLAIGNLFAKSALQVLCPLKPDPPPVIDADPDEWQNLPLEIEIGEKNVTWGKAKWDGEEDLSGIIKLCYDQNYLYILADVVDEKITVAPGREMFSCDHVELTFYAKYELGQKGPINNDWRVIGFSPGTMDPVGDIFTDITPEAYIVRPINTDSSNIDVEAKETEEGYLLEARIPWEILGVKKPVKLGQYFGFDIHLSDSDSGQDQETLTSLNPKTWAGRQTENLLQLILTGTEGKMP